MIPKSPGPAQPASTSSFLYPPAPVYDVPGETSPPTQPGASSPLYPAQPAYASAPPAAPTLAVVDGPGLTTRFVCASPGFQAAATAVNDLVAQPGDPVMFAIPPGADGKPIAVQLDASFSPPQLTETSSSGDDQRWGAISVALDPPDALLRPLPSGTKVTMTPSWTTVDSRTIGKGRARAVLLVHATVQGA
jgi:hypothetical protein